MILYYTDQGQIKGCIEGRIHTDHMAIEHFENGVKLNKLIIEWKPIMYFDKEGNMVDKDFPDIYASEYEPDHEQSELIMLFEKNPMQVYNYSVDIATKKLIKI